jgi:hypothetical protein
MFIKMRNIINFEIRKKIKFLSKECYNEFFYIHFFFFKN